MNFTKPLHAAVLLAGAACASAATPSVHADDLVLLPAPASAWRTVVAHWEQQAELSGDSVVLPRPSADYAKDTVVSGAAHTQDGQRDTLLLSWQNAWYAGLKLESRAPLDLRPWLQGTLEFDLNVDRLGQGGVSVQMGCGPGCERKVSLLTAARGWVGQGWQHVSLALSCFDRSGSDFSKVGLPFAVDGTGSGQVSVANVRLRSMGRPSLACPDHRTQSVTPDTLNEAWAIDWWLPRHEKKLAEIRAHRDAGRNVDLVFVGDSITEGWEKSGQKVWDQHFAKYNALDLGFGGDRTENLLWRLQHGEIDGIRPKAVVMLIGTNNTGHRGEDPALIVAGIRRDLAEIRHRQPQAKVLLMAIFPRDELPDGALRRHNDQVNALLPALADGRNVVLLDIGKDLLQPDGVLSKDVMPDFLHPNERGYEIWARHLDAALAPWLKH